MQLITITHINPFNQTKLLANIYNNNDVIQTDITT